MKAFCYTILIVITVFSHSWVIADTPYSLQNDRQVQVVSEDCSQCIFVMKDSLNLQAEDLKNYGADFIPFSEATKDFFDDDESKYWMKVLLKNDTEVYQKWKTYLGWFNLGEVHVFDGDHQFIKKTQIGQYAKGSLREENRGRGSVMNIELYPGEERIVYVKAWNINHVEVQFYVVLVENAYWNGLMNKRYWNGGIFFGVLLIMFLYNIFLFLMSKDKIYLYYSLYILNVSAYFFVFDGFSREYLLGEIPLLEPYVWAIALGLAPMFYFQFMSAYSNSAVSLPKLHPYIKGTVYLSLIATFLGVIILLVNFDVYLTGKILLSILAIEAVFGMIVLYALFRTRSRLNYYLIIGSLLLWITGLAGLYFGYMDEFGIGLEVASQGVLVEILIFSLGLSHRMRLQRKDKELAQKALIIQLKENEIIQREANLKLEEKVKERTKELAHINEELKEKNQQLNTLSEEKSHLISIVAHDLRNPLTSALSLSQSLQDDSADMTQDQQDCAEYISQALERMNTMIQQILDVRAAEKQMLNMKKELVNTNDVIQEVSQRFLEKASKKDINLHVDIEDIYVTADRNLLMQVVENLVSNAVKFSPPHAQVNISNYHMGNFSRIEVEDEGPGLTEEDHEKLFKKFQKLSAKPTAGEHSTGLGLSIVKKFTEEMGGNVWCESEKGDGAIFVIEMPKVDVPEE